jgi:hypothetical protein
MAVVVLRMEGGASAVAVATTCWRHCWLSTRGFPLPVTTNPNTYQSVVTCPLFAGLWLSVPWRSVVSRPRMRSVWVIPGIFSRKLCCTPSTGVICGTKAPTLAFCASATMGR